MKNSRKHVTMKATAAPTAESEIRVGYVDWHKFDIETLSLGNAFINCPIMAHMPCIQPRLGTDTE